LFPWVRN